MRLASLIWIVICGAVLAASPSPPELLKPAPDARVQPFRERLTALVRERYPELLAGGLVGTPVLTVLFNPDGSIARSNLQLVGQTTGTLTANETQFAQLGVRAGQLQYVGEARVQLPTSTVLVVFGARTTEVLDRELVQYYFPQALAAGSKGDGSLWILFDHGGHVLQHGAEALASSDLRKTLETRYPGIRISDSTVAPVSGRNGGVQLNCLWLAMDSPLPLGH